MKIEKYIVLFVVLISLFIVTSCKNAPIFATIENEVKLNEFSVKGAIIAFTEQGNKVFVANSETVFSKLKNSLGNWEPLGVPAGVGPIQNIVSSNGTNLFASFAGVEGKNGGVWYYDSSWHKVTNSENIQCIFGDGATLFGTDLKKVYKVTTSGTTEILGVTGILVGASGEYFAIGNKLYFWNGSNAIEKTNGGKLNGQKISTIISVCKGEGSTIFLLTDSKLYNYDGTNLTELTLSGEKRTSISYFKEKKIVLIGCIKGYTEVHLAESQTDLTGATQISAGDSGSLTPPAVYSQYNSMLGSFSISPIIAVAQEGSNYTILAGVNAGKTYKKTGLWAYYSSGKQEWNRE